MEALISRNSNDMSHYYFMIALSTPFNVSNTRVGFIQMSSIEPIDGTIALFISFTILTIGTRLYDRTRRGRCLCTIILFYFNIRILCLMQKI